MMSFKGKQTRRLEMRTRRGRKGQWTLTSWLAAFLLLAAFGLPRAAHGAVCNGAFDILQKGFCSTTTNQGCQVAADCPVGETCKTFDFFDPGNPKGNGGNQLRVNLAIGAGSISVGTPPQLTVNRIRFDLDCKANTGFPCTDQGPVVQYGGDATITTTCAGVTWTSSTAQGGNEIVFNASKPIIIGQNCSARGAVACGNCELEFMIAVQTQEPSGSDATPQVVEEVAGYVNGGGDATCSATLQSGSSQTSDLPICPSCTIDECNNGCDQTTGTCVAKDASTPCTDTDGNSCTTAGCELNASNVMVCAQTHVSAPNNTPCGTDADTTDCLLPACVSGVCQQKTIPDTNKVNMPCTSTPDTPSNCLVPCCDGTGVCAESSSAAQANPTGCAVPDSTPCTDSDGNACTTAGCNGQGVCDQTHGSKVCCPVDE